MPYKSLREFVARLEKDGELVRVTEPVSTVLEMTEIQTRLIAQGGPAVIFEKPIKADGSASDMPVLVNLFGTVKRVAMGVTMGGVERSTGADLREVGELLAQLRQPQPPRSFGEAAGLLPLVKTIVAMKPKTVGRPACQEIVLKGDDIDLSNLPQGQRIFYRVRFEDLSDARNISLPATGSFLSAPPRGRNISFAWAADVVGQGWGINPEWGGLKMFETMRRAQPDFFVHCGDTIYADGVLEEAVRLPDGTIWKNVVTPAKSKVAETLDEYRGNHLYNMLDEHVRRFNAEVPQMPLWDDHEVRNNWYPGEVIADSDARYTEKSVAVLAARARQAFVEYNPLPVFGDDLDRIYRSIPMGPLVDVFALDMRSYKGANSENICAASGTWATGT